MTRFRLLILGLALLSLLGTAQRPASAFAEIEDVSKARAKELGITVLAQPRPDSGDVWVQVEFRSKGALKGFRWADLGLVKDGKRLICAALMPREPAGDSKPDTVRLDFYVEPALLSGATVTVFSYNQPRGGIGYCLKMKDYPPAAR